MRRIERPFPWFQARSLPVSAHLVNLLFLVLLFYIPTTSANVSDRDNLEYQILLLSCNFLYNIYFSFSGPLENQTLIFAVQGQRNVIIPKALNGPALMEVLRFRAGSKVGINHF